MNKSIQEDSLASALSNCIEECTECKACVKQCAFLSHYGTPKNIAESIQAKTRNQYRMAFECSLCRLCHAVCPVKLDPSKVFLELRRHAVDSGQGDFSEHTIIVNFEKRGTSKHFSQYLLPAGCDTIFFPGCALPGSRPQRVKDVLQLLQDETPAIGIVLDCCTKPSLDLGRENHFQKMFSEMCSYLHDKGIKNVITACTNCYRTFTDHAHQFNTKTIYEYISENIKTDTLPANKTVTIHDPCGVRFADPVLDSVRHIITCKGLKIEEMRHKKKRTFCCGEGGSACYITPNLTDQWSMLRKKEANGYKIITYCAGCAGFLGKIHPTVHLLDLFFSPDTALSGKEKGSRSPFTYMNRFLLKRWLKKNIDAENIRHRPKVG